MPKRIRLGTVTNGTLDSTDATIEIDGDDLYITVENGDVRTDGTVTFEDATADPSANGEIQRNGADLKAFSGGAVRNLTSPTFESVTAGEADVTNETFVAGHLGTDVAGVSSGTFTNIIDTEDNDVRDELNGSFEFSPDTTGWYEINAQAEMQDGATGDDYQIRLFNVTDTISVKFKNVRNSGANPTIEFNPVANLNSAKDYIVHITNNTSSYGIDSGSGKTFATIRKSVVHP